MNMKRRAALFAAFVASVTADPVDSLQKRQSNIASVNLGQRIGPPQHLGSGVLYGLPLNNPNDGQAQATIPERFLTEMGFNFARSGGDAWQAPNLGYSYGLDQYRYRFQDVLTHYRTVRKYGGGMFIILSGLWGLDGGPPMPGDNGDWAQYDAFLTQVIGDIKSAGIEEGTIVEIWNEPDNNAWPRDKAQHLEMWGRGVARLRAELPGVQIGGPSTANGPGWDQGFTNWAKFVGANNSAPDVYVWHALNGGVTPTDQLSTLNRFREEYDLPERDINLNEYLALDELGPSYVTFYLSQFERLGIRGLKANWGRGETNADALHNYLANSLGPLGAKSGYYPNGEWQVYKYYTTAMTGQRVATTSAADQRFEVYATVDSGTARLLTSARGTTDKYSITVSGLSSMGVYGRAKLQVYAFKWNDVFGEVGDPENLGVTTLQVADDIVTFEVGPRSKQEAYAFEISKA